MQAYLADLAAVQLDTDGGTDLVCSVELVACGLELGSRLCLAFGAGGHAAPPRSATSITMPRQYGSPSSTISNVACGMLVRKVQL